VWDAGTVHGYHAVSYGHLVGEVVRRVTDRSLGTFFAEEVAAPLGLDFHIGLPGGLGDRVSRLEQLAIVAEDPGPTGDAEADAQRGALVALIGPDSLFGRALMPTKPSMDFNDPALHAAEIPAANGITTARSLARMYAATVGEVDGIRVLDAATVDAVRTEQSAGPDKVLMIPTRFGLGFMLHSEFAPLLGDGSYGHPGAGGSLGFADPEAEIGFGYVMNKMQQNLSGDPRPAGLIAAVRTSLAALS